MRAPIQKLVARCLILLLINEVNCETKPFDFYKAFKTPKESYEESCAELDKMEILERSNFSSEDEKEDADVEKLENGKNSALAQVHVKFGNNNGDYYQKDGLELGHHPVQYNFYMSGQPMHHFMPFFNPHWGHANFPMCVPQYNFHSNLHHIPSELNHPMAHKTFRRSESGCAPNSKLRTTQEASQKLSRFIETYQNENKIAGSSDEELDADTNTEAENELFDRTQRKTHYRRLAKLSDEDLGLLLEFFDSGSLRNVTNGSKKIAKRSVGYTPNRLIPSVFIKNVIFEPCRDEQKPTDDKLIISDSLKFIALNMSDLLDTVCDCIDELSLEKEKPSGGLFEREREEYPLWANEGQKYNFL